MTDADAREPQESSGSQPSGVVQNMAVLNLTGIKSADELRRISGISNVAVVLVRASLEGVLAQIPMHNVAMIVPIPDDEGITVKMQTGQMRISGWALQNPTGSPSDILVVVGQLVLDPPVSTIGYKLVVIGQLIAPKEVEAEISSKLVTLVGQAVYYHDHPYIVFGSESLGKEFFELLDHSIDLIVMGECTVNKDVSVDLFREKVTGIHNLGELKVPNQLLAIAQAKTVFNMGMIQTMD
ncbi:MAG TPA: hypothetical protein GXX55_08060 [Firmicutes bacterium]|nr:hypothetical protein [Bacillota bacterium]